MGRGAVFVGDGEEKTPAKPPEIPGFPFPSFPDPSLLLSYKMKSPAVPAIAAR